MTDDPHDDYDDQLDDAGLDWPELTADETIRLTRASRRGVELAERVRGRGEPVPPADEPLPAWVDEPFDTDEDRRRWVELALRDVGAHPGLTDYVQGETPRAIAEDVFDLAENFPAPPPVPDLRQMVGAFVPRQPTAGNDMDSFIRNRDERDHGAHFVIRGT